MNKIILRTIFLLLCCGSAASAQAIFSIGYDTPFGQGYQDMTTLNYAALTHISFVGGQPNSDGTVTLSTNLSSIAPGVITAAHANNLKVLFCLTVIFAPTGFTGAITNHEAAFIANIMSTVNTYGFDGVDVDDEETFSNALMTTFLTDLRTNIGTGLLFSTALGNVYADWTSALAAKVDRVNMMTYVLDGTWEPYTWFTSPLYGPVGDAAWSVDYIRRLFQANSSVPNSKLGIGFIFIGDLWTPNTGPRQTFGGSPSYTMVEYTNIVANYNTAGATFDSVGLCPWIAVSGSSYLTYENPQSIIDKVSYVKAQGLGGWIIWHLGSDAAGATGTEPLLNAVGQAMSLNPVAPSKVGLLLSRVQ